jgi:hypothetical protein
MNIPLKADHAIEMSFWGVFWSSFMQNVGPWLMMLGECSTRCHLRKCGKEALKHLELCMKNLYNEMISHFFVTG